MTAALDLCVFDKRHGARSVLRDVHLALQPGEIVSLVGASGCGKSTLLSIAAGLDTAYRGRVLLDGNGVTGPVDGIGLMFQEPRLFPWLTAAQNIGFGGEADWKRISSLLDEVGLAGRGNALPHQLSGGEAQRVALARGLYLQPRVMLLDEPFSAVDALTRRQLQEVLLTVTRERAATVLLVTHDLDEALFLSDRIVLLDEIVSSFDIPHGSDAAAKASIKEAILERLQPVQAC